VVDPKGLAAQMGLKADDAIRKVNTMPISTAKDLTKALDTINVGEVRITVVRGPNETVEIHGQIMKEPGKEVYFFFPAVPKRN
jgi:S1-C subfamily serine protease